jgi:hypothetical protein
MCFISYENIKTSSYAKSENRMVEQILPWGVHASGRGEEMEKGCRRVDIVQILCTHVCKWKNETVKLFQKWGGDEGEWWRR